MQASGVRRRQTCMTLKYVSGSHWSLTCLLFLFPPALCDMHPMRALFLIPRNPPPRLKSKKWWAWSLSSLSKHLSCQHTDLSLSMKCQLQTSHLTLFLQVEEVLQLYRGLPGEELHPASSHWAAAEAPLHQGPAQREAGPHPAQRPHRPNQEEEGREGWVPAPVCFSVAAAAVQLKHVVDIIQQCCSTFVSMGQKWTSGQTCAISSCSIKCADICLFVSERGGSERTSFIFT